MVRSATTVERQKLRVSHRRHLFVSICGWVFFAVLLQVLAHAAELRTVKQVTDGDTILLENGEVVSLIGVDAPEIKHATKAGAEMGKESAERTLAYVFLEDGTFLNAEIIKHGYGFTFPGFVHKYQSEFRRLEREARENKRGLWGKEP